jgi:hypothetical protein
MKQSGDPNQIPRTQSRFEYREPTLSDFSVSSRKLIRMQGVIHVVHLRLLLKP